MEQWTLTGAPTLDRKFLDSFRSDFLQHHPHVADGVEGLRMAIESHVWNTEHLRLHKIFGEGNFVLSVCEGLRQGKPSALYDLFRIEEGKIAEHWSIYQAIPTENIANNNTMFNFSY